jgi:hypothetical protein
MSPASTNNRALSAVGSADELYAFPDCREYPLAKGMVLTVHPNGINRAVLSSDAVIMLNSCRSYKRVEDHSAYLLDTMPELRSREALVQKTLSQVIDSGLFERGSSFTEALVSSEAVVTKPPVVAILTCERPGALSRLLDSILSNCSADSAELIFIIDDSNKVENQQLNKCLVDDYNRKSDIKFRYFGDELQAELLASLIAAAPELESSYRFMADRRRWRDEPSYGRSRNVALLLSIGRRLVVLDDDILCEALDPPESDAGVSFFSNQREMDFFSGEEDFWQDFRRQSDRDPIKCHAAVLGHTLADAMGVLGKDPGLHDLQGAPASVASRMSGESRVISTACGTLGDPGTVTNSNLLGLTDSSYGRLFGVQDKLAWALQERCIWSGSKQLAVLPSSNMSQILGLDNRVLLPPYFPVHRVEDALFGIMSSFVQSDSVVLDLPWAVAHLPMPRRRWETLTIDTSRLRTYPALIFRQVAALDQAAASTNPEQRLLLLAKYYRELASTPYSEVRR